MPDAWIWSMGANCINALYQAKDIVFPMSSEHVGVSIIYQAGSLVSIALLLYAKFNNGRGPMLTLVWWVCVYTSFRQGIRNFDYEETISEFDDKNQWNLLVIINTIAMSTTAIVCTNCFEQTRFKLFVLGLLVLFMILTVYVGVFAREDLK